MQLPSGEEIPLPPIILGHLGSDPGKKTVCIYGHLDVQPANIDDGWDTEPFTLVEKDGKKLKLFSFIITKAWEAVCKMSCDLNQFQGFCYNFFGNITPLSFYMLQNYISSY